MYEIRNAKNIIREKHKKKRNAITPDKKRELDTKICNRIISLVSFRYAETVLLYAPVNSEIDISPVAEAALSAGKRVAYPRCIPESAEMKFHFVSSTEELSLGYMNIPEPSESAPEFDRYNTADSGKCLCIIPALAFDKRGYRIGYGKGYYDRYLSGVDLTRAGVIYGELLVDRVPNGRFDLKVDFIVSERGVVLTNEN